MDECANGIKRKLDDWTDCQTNNCPSRDRKAKELTT